jgi:hypothetical protein
VPSPKLQWYEPALPVAVKTTCSGAVPVVALAEADTVGGAATAAGLKTSARATTIAGRTILSVVA